MDLEAISEQIKHNCNISDARYWGYFSPCGFLLNMQELFCHERSILPWKTPVKEDVIDWMGEKEILWDQLENEEFQDVSIGENNFYPFDAAEINKFFIDEGLFYSGGYGLLRKPTFSLSKLKERKFEGPYEIIITSGHIIRDLTPPLAFSLDNQIVLNQGLLARYLYHRFILWEGRKAKGLSDDAFSYFGITKRNNSGEDVYKQIEDMAEGLAPLVISHEIGEIEEGKKSIEWKEIIMAARERIFEYNLRAIMDILADTAKNGPMNYIFNKRDKGLLLAYLVMMDEVHKKLFPGIFTAYDIFKENSDWGLIKSGIDESYKDALNLKNEIVNKWNENKEIRDIEKIISCKGIR